MGAADPNCLDEAIDWLRKHFQPPAARGLSADFAIHLSGEGGGSILLRVRDEALEVGVAPAGHADVRLRLPSSDYFGILAGRENADLLYMAGQLEIEGDPSLAMKLRTLFRPGPARDG
jgi:putative sterol carrier protein